ncbi:MAG: GUN4 domain-containing protein [Brasilonema octagenarum HA4186-MV1]|jgi:DNA polymerase III alpha subunit (gram-positive type)|nr:GUN4 domain-containing protein [Brasilonema octagenarum HA4186-MV1]
MNWLAISISVAVVVTVAVGVLLWSKWKKRLLTQLKQEKHQLQEIEHRLLAQLEQEKHQRQETERRLLAQLEQEKHLLTQLKQEKHQLQEIEHRLLAQLEQEKHQRQETERRLLAQLEQEKHLLTQLKQEKHQLQETEHRLLAQLEQEKRQRQEIERRLLAQLEQEKHQHQEARKLKDLSQQQLTLQKTPKLTTTLRDLLVSGRWKEADHETLRIMLNLTNREQEGWLNVASIHNFPHEDLRAIDQLWVESSNGRFGFSVQQRIWKSVGGNLKANDKIYEAFGDCVEWRVHKNWLQINELTFNSSAPTGHLPAVAVRLGGLSWGIDGFLWEKRDAYVFLLCEKDW